DLHVHLLLLLKEAPRRVRDRLIVIRDLVDHDRLDPDPDPLRRYTLKIEFRRVDVEREPTHLLQPGGDPSTLTDHDLEPETGGVTLRPVMCPIARDNQRLVRLGDPVQKHPSLLLLPP